MSMAMAMDINERLWRVAEQQSQQLGRPFGAGAESNFRQALGAAVSRMEAEGVAADEAAISRAEESVRRIVSRMAEEAESRGWAELHEPTLQSALAGLCPIWPFC